MVQFCFFPAEVPGKVVHNTVSARARLNGGTFLVPFSFFKPFGDGEKKPDLFFSMRAAL